eukprot:scaffold14905_cov72-Skeletonema_dohrnii-CCMP3373.AAC.1
MVVAFLRFGVGLGWLDLRRTSRIRGSTFSLSHQIEELESNLRRISIIVLNAHRLDAQCNDTLAAATFQQSNA